MSAPVQDKITYEGPAKYAQVAIDAVLADLRPDHTNFQNSPSNLLELSDGVQLHVIAYNRPKQGVRIVCSIYNWRSENVTQDD